MCSIALASNKPAQIPPFPEARRESARSPQNATLVPQTSRFQTLRKYPSIPSKGGTRMLFGSILYHYTEHAPARISSLEMEYVPKHAHGLFRSVKAAKKLPFVSVCLTATTLEFQQTMLSSTLRPSSGPWITRCATRYSNNAEHS